MLGFVILEWSIALVTLYVFWRLSRGVGQVQ
jgi:hypothetical protein